MPEKHKIVLTVLAPFSRLRWQLPISLVVSAAAVYTVMSAGKVGATSKLLQPTQVLSVLGVIGALLALASSISYSHLGHFITESKKDLRNSYHQFQSELFEINDLIGTFSEDSPIVKKTHEMTYAMGFLRRDDIPFPFFDEWDDWVKPIMKELGDTSNDGELDPDRQELLVRLIYAEEILNSIGVAHVRQVLSEVVLRPVMKSLALMAGIIISGISVYFLDGIANAQEVIIAIPVFFATFASLIFIETGYYVYRYTHDHSRRYLRSATQDLSDQNEEAT